MEGHSYILFISSYENQYKMTILSCSCHRPNEWQIKLIKTIDKYFQQYYHNINK